MTLTWKGVPFEFSPAQIEAQADLKQALLKSLALQPIDYQLEPAVILVVDTSQIAVRFYLCQANLIMLKKCFFARFGSLPLNDQERHFSQPKLELYSLYQALHTRCSWLGPGT